MLTKTIWFATDGGAPNDADYVFSFAVDFEDQWGFYDSKEELLKNILYDETDGIVVYKATINIEKEERN